VIYRDEDLLRALGISKDYWELLGEVDSCQQVIKKLNEEYDLMTIASSIKAQNNWQNIALYYRYTQNRYYQAFEVISGLYEQMIKYQLVKRERIHKGMPLVWLRDFSLLIGNRVIAKRYAMLTLCEDVIRDYEKTPPLNKKAGGIYFRLAYYHGMSDIEINNYADKIFEVYEKNSVNSMYPEWILQEIDNDWITDYPTDSEFYSYKPNLFYIKHLLGSIKKDKKGIELERLAEYLLSIVPGFRTYRRLRSETTDYDILCNVEGTSMDYRAELGRYFICECKDWEKPVDVTTITKFFSVLESAKCKSGILFSRKGISGEDSYKYAKREVIKAFQRSGLTVLIIDESDIDKISKGQNLISLLRKKYEETRFDLPTV